MLLVRKRMHCIQLRRWYNRDGGTGDTERFRDGIPCIAELAGEPYGARSLRRLRPRNRTRGGIDDYAGGERREKRAGGDISSVQFGRQSERYMFAGRGKP